VKTSVGKCIVSLKIRLKMIFLGKVNAVIFTRGQKSASCQRKCPLHVQRGREIVGREGSPREVGRKKAA
jgi:hypothetical protein